MVDAEVSKTFEGDLVGVRVPSSAPKSQGRPVIQHDLPSFVLVPKQSIPAEWTES